ncbi:hypothetical protein [Reyranella sp. CPCC 100927]|uniref:hypothetical protein n=1 Tax=Reyranella sp. CPCC 100927 TaxID=2599616 RepID=UPI0011B7763D|nr:hypothetical protein [Reyranella sp. CPCC 100927]TWS94990.1 hypothetical protein FQU96_40795 [Reyranella sp. CPCC 100927]
MTYPLPSGGSQVSVVPPTKAAQQFSVQDLADLLIEYIPWPTPRCARAYARTVLIGCDLGRWNCKSRAAAMIPTEIAIKNDWALPLAAKVMLTAVGLEVFLAHAAKALATRGPIESRSIKVA